MKTESKRNRAIAIVTINGFFGQSIPTEKSLDLEQLKKCLQAAGFSIRFVELEDLANAEHSTDQSDTTFLIGSHQNSEIKNYINDVVALSTNTDGTEFLPRSELILAHDNKGIQCLLGHKYNLNLPKQDYRITTRPPEALSVIKHVTGAGSQKVFIAKKSQNYSTQLKTTGLNLLSVSDLLFYLKWPIKKLLKWKYFTNDYIKFNKRYFRHVRQSFIESPGYDFKVLVFYDRVYALRRGQRAGDFRASGSGNFTFEKPSIELVRFALEFRRKINTPYISLDVIQDNNTFECIEFQCAHFGPYTQIFAPYYYTIECEDLIEATNSFTIEESYAHAISLFIENRTPEIYIKC